MCIRDSPDTVAVIHWAGTKNIFGDPNGAVLKRICAMPDSAKVQDQTLQKLSIAPWFLLNRPLDTNSAILLPPLLEQAIESELYLEIRQMTNGPGEMVFAIRLNPAQAAAWETNLARAMESLTGIRPVTMPGTVGWKLKKHHLPNLIELTRSGEWTLLGAGPVSYT